MKRWQLIILFCTFLFLTTDVSFAAGLIYRQQQIKAMKQQQAQAQYQQEYQEYQQQGGQGQQGQAQPTYQETVDQRNQAIAQAILDAHNRSISTDNSQGFSQGHSTTAPASANSSDGEQTVDISEVWKRLDNKSTAWSLLIDDQAKLLTVSEYLDRFHKEGVKISAPPLHYVQMIDQIVKENPQMLQRPFGELLQIAAIVDYDFDNGMNKDDLARKVLGEAGFEENKKRFSQ